jgi:nitroreductase
MSDTSLAALHERYAPDDRPDAPLIDHPVLAALLNHRSVRAYTDRPLPPGIVESLVAAAQSAATSSNLQTWSVVAVREPARIARLAALAGGQGFVATAPLFLVWVADLSRNQRLGEAGGKVLEGIDYLESFLVAAIDAALAAQNAAVAAEALGLGTCYIGALRNQPEAVAAELNLPPNAMGLFGMAVGYPAGGPASAIKPRLPQSVVLHHETYGVPEVEPAAVARYDRAMAAFSLRVGQGEVHWLPRMFSRLAGGHSLSGRDRIRAALTALGFRLK